MPDTPRPEAETVEVLPDCGCIRCIDANHDPIRRPAFKPSRTRMVVCSICGNKRCPHATYHGYACTGSNEPGQPGSVFGPPMTDAPVAPLGAERPDDDVLSVLRSLSPSCWSSSFVWNHGTLQYEDVLSGVVDESRSSETRKVMLLKAVGEMLAKNKQIDALFKRLESSKAVPEGERQFFDPAFCDEHNRHFVKLPSFHAAGCPECIVKERDSLDVTLDDEEAAHQDTLRLWQEAKERIAALEAELEAHKHCLSCIDACLERAGGKMGESNRGEVIDGLGKERDALTAKLAEAEKQKFKALDAAVELAKKVNALESQLAAAQGEVERWKRLHDLEAKCSGVVSYQLDRIREHIDKDGNLLGDSRWRIAEVMSCVKALIAADDEANRAMDEIEDGVSAARQGQERGE